MANKKQKSTKKNKKAAKPAQIKKVKKVIKKVKVVAKKTTKPAQIKKVSAKKAKPVKKITAKAKTKKGLTTKTKVLPQLQPIKKNIVAAKKTAPIDYSKAITPLADRLVVKVVSGERVTAGGLIIPNTASMAAGFLKAEVLAVGAGAKNKKGMLRPLDVKVGDTVLFSEHSGTKIKFNAEDLQIIHESDVMGILQN